MNPAHYDYETLADLAEGLLEDDTAASVNAHLDTCAECRSRSADLADVSRLLAEAPVPSMPAELASRIDSAIAAESLNSATVVSLEHRRGRRHWRVLSAAAAAVVVVGGGALLGGVVLQSTESGDVSGSKAPALDNPRAHTGGGDGGGAAEPPEDRAKRAPAAGTYFEVTRTGTAYRSGTLAQQVNGALDAPAQRSQASAPDQNLIGCVTRVTGGKRPSLVDQATYDGRTATVIAADGSTANTVQIWVVGPNCSPQTPDVLTKTTTTRN